MSLTDLTLLLNLYSSTMENAQGRKSNLPIFHMISLYEVPKVIKVIETESKMVFATAVDGSGGGERCELKVVQWVVSIL